MKLESHEIKTIRFEMFRTLFNDHPEYRKDPKIVMYAVMQDGGNLQFADEGLRKNFDIVMEAVKNKGEAIMFADPTLKADPKIVMAAIQQSGWAIQYTPFKNDINFVMAALAQINFDPEWSNMYGPNDPIFAQVHERMQAMGVGTGARH